MMIGILKLWVPVGFLSVVLNAQTVTFKGVVSDSVNGMLLDSVMVSAGGASTLTDSKGAFTLTASGAVAARFASPGRFPALKWDPATGAFSWNGFSGAVSITVHNLKGDVVARGGSPQASTYSLAPLPSGTYMVDVAAKGQTSRFRFNYAKESRTPSFALSPENPPLKKSAAEYALTFTKNNFNNLTLNVAAGSEGNIQAKMKSPYPLKNILKLFLDPTIPDKGPGEAPNTPDCGGAADPVMTLPGGQLNAHDFIMVGENYRRINLVLGGKVVWHYDTQNSWEDDEIWVLSNGNVLHAHLTYIEELTPHKDVVWRYNPPAGAEIHTCQPIGVDKVLFLQNQLPNSSAMLYNVATKQFEINKPIPQLSGTVHTQCRRFRMTKDGGYIAASMVQQTLFAFDKDFNMLWSKKTGSMWGAVPLKNGNFLLQREGSKEAAEITPNIDTVWSVSIPEVWNQVMTLAPGSVAVTATQTSERLSSGNTVIFTRYCTANLPQAIEITPDKKVVWILRDQKDLGDAATMQFLDEPGYPELPGETNH